MEREVVLHVGSRNWERPLADSRETKDGTSTVDDERQKSRRVDVMSATRVKHDCTR